MHRGWGEEPGYWLIFAQRCRKLERKRGTERRANLPSGLFQGLTLCVALLSSSAPLCSPLPFFSCYCPKTGSQAVLGQPWLSPLRQQPPLLQKTPFELSELSFSSSHLTPFLCLLPIRYTTGGQAIEDKLVCFRFVTLSNRIFRLLQTFNQVLPRLAGFWRIALKERWFRTGS